MKFAEFVKQKRLDQNLSLRKFCELIDFDASNWSKIERGIMPPPKESDATTLYQNISKVLKLNGDQYFELLSNSALDRKEIPTFVYNNQEILDALPIFFRTAFNGKPSKRQLQELIDILKSR